MAGIRDKTLLLFIAFGYGLYRLFREKHNKAEHQKQTGNADAYAGQQKGEEGGEFPLAVQKIYMVAVSPESVVTATA